MNEILDQLVEIDLAAGFRCTDDYLVKHQQAGAWKQKLQAYAEQTVLADRISTVAAWFLHKQKAVHRREMARAVSCTTSTTHKNTVCSSKKLAISFSAFGLQSGFVCQMAQQSRYSE
ncbi:hypothetical protein D5086_023538 [Populus alba]|uniref:Uncharacterized protein n=1 Tax=Populus alba TaxID=43335 RepID=A0ACC4BBL2_POPAL